jgi:hypothetical protein
MGAKKSGPKRGFWRGLGRGLDRIFEVFDLIEVLGVVARAATLVIRLLAKLLDALW